MKRETVRRLSMLIVLLSVPGFAFETRAQVAELLPLRQRVVVGEPLVLDLVVRNDSLQPVQSRSREDIAYARCEFSVSAYVEETRVARWSYRSDASDTPLYKSRRPGTDRWMFELQPGAEFRCRQLVVLLQAPPAAATPVEERFGFAPVDGRDDKPRSERRVTRQPTPLGPGRYTLVANLPWIDAPLQAGPVEIEIVEPTSPQDREAAKLVDDTFRSFLADHSMIDGFAGGQPTGSVKRILEQYPDSVQARIARARLLLHRVRQFFGSGPLPESERHARPRALDEDIGAHLAGSANDPLELELLHARVRLLTDSEYVDKVEGVLTQMAAKYPESGYTRAARKLVEARRVAPNGSDGPP